MLQNLQPINPEPIVNTFIQYGLAGVMLIVLIAAVYMQNKSFAKERKDFNARLNKVMDDHKADLKEGTRDLKSVIDRYHNFINEVRLLIKDR